MNSLLLLFMSNPEAAQGGGGGFLATWGMLIPLFLIMYLLLIRPQRKRQKEHEKLLTELKRGDKIVTNSGMFGTVFAIDDEKNKVVVKITDEIKVEFLKSSIAGKVDS